MSEDKLCTKDPCWSVGTIYDTRELSGVSTADPRIGRGVTCGIRANPHGFTGVCVLGGSSIWRMWAWIGHMAWHMTTLETQTWLRGEVPRLGLTDEDVGLLRGWIVISWPLGWDILAQGLIGLIEYPYQQGASYFSEAYLERTSNLSVLGLEQFGVGDRPESFLGCA
jgi:hypothetical protein